MMDIILKKKIGQMMMCGFASPYFDEKAKRLVDELFIGNFVLFSRNIRDKETTLRLCAELGYHAHIKLGKQPFISIDEECGMVRRLHGVTTPFPGCLAVAAAGDASLAGQMGEMLGKELIDVGINMDFAPDIDVNVNPDNPVIGMRSYGDKPENVASFGISMAEGLRKSGVVPVFKHFPGHGDTAVDSHFGIPSIDHSMERLNRIELYPFKKALLNGAECFMVSHLLFRSIDPENPATLSYKVIRDFLKTKLGFNGIAISDCMEMAAITKNCNIGEACVRAVLSGIDIVLVSHTYEAQEEASEAIYRAVQEGRISMGIIDSALERIDRSKRGLPGLNFKPVYDHVKHNEFARNLYRRSITLADGTIPAIHSDTCVCLGVKAFQGTPAEDIPSPELDFSHIVSKSLHCDSISFDKDIDDKNIDELVRRAENKDLIILGIGDAHRFLNQRKLYNRLLERKKRMIVVSLRMPYDLAGLLKPTAHLCTYEYTFMAIEALCLVMKGELNPTGVLPLKI